MPSLTVDELAATSLPEVDPKEPAKLFFKCVLANLPKKYSGKLYETPPKLGNDFAAFLGSDYANAPVLHIAGTIGLLDAMSKDTRFDHQNRRHIDQTRTTAFFDIIGRRRASSSVSPVSDMESSWPNGFIHTLPFQTTRLLEECHMWVYKEAQGWDLARRLFAPSNVMTEQHLESLWNGLHSRVTDDMYTLTLRQQVIGSAGCEAVMRTLRRDFTKLGLVERSIWSKRRRSSESGAGAHEQHHDSVRETTPAVEWASVDLQDRIPRTNACMGNVCYGLAVSVIGAVDDTVRAQIREIPSRMLRELDGFHFLDLKWSWDTQYISPMTEALLLNCSYFEVLPSLPKSNSPPRSVYEKSFVEEQARAMMCWKD